MLQFGINPGPTFSLSTLPASIIFSCHFFLKLPSLSALVSLPFSAVSPRPGPAAGPGPSHSPAPCRSAPLQPTIDYWQRDNLPCQQKKPECATDRPTVRSEDPKIKNKNEVGRKKATTAQIGEVGRGGKKDQERVLLLLSVVSVFFNVVNIRRVQSENPRCCCEKKSFPSELRGCWEEPAAPTGCSPETSCAAAGTPRPLPPFHSNAPCVCTVFMV